MKMFDVVPLASHVPLSDLVVGDLIAYWPHPGHFCLVLDTTPKSVKLLTIVLNTPDIDTDVDVSGIWVDRISNASAYVMLISRIGPYQHKMFKPLQKELHEPPPEGRFGAVRKHDVHTGVDLYTDVGDRVYAIESGMVVAVVPFTGIPAGSPWWLDTDALMIEGVSGVILYGEIVTEFKVGDFVFAGDRLGEVKRVLKKDKGKPVSMLHLECYTPGTKEPVWWNLGEPQPECLLDPTFLVEKYYVVPK